MALDTRMGYNNPDEGLIGGSSLRNERKGRGVTEMAVKVRLENRKNQLKMDRLTWWSNWLDLGTYFRPYRGRWLTGRCGRYQQGLAA